MMGTFLSQFLHVKVRSHLKSTRRRSVCAFEKFAYKMSVDECMVFGLMDKSEAEIFFVRHKLEKQLMLLTSFEFKMEICWGCLYC